MVEHSPKILASEEKPPPMYVQLTGLREKKNVSSMFCDFPNMKMLITFHESVGSSPVTLILVPSCSMKM